MEFRGVATIVPSKGASVPVLIWELDNRDLPTLNKYEATPVSTGRKKWPLKWTENLRRYGISDESWDISPPSQMYYNTILQGYRENGLDKSYLQTALENSLQIEHMVNDEFDEEYCAEDYDGYYDIDDFQMKF